MDEIDIRAQFDRLDAITENVTASIDGDVFILRIDLTEEHGKSSSGRNFNVASTRGFQEIPGKPGCRFNLNVIRVNPEFRDGRRR